MGSRARGRGREKALFQELEPDMRLFVVGRIAYLEGSVSCYDRKKALAQLAADLPLVEQVVNRLRVAPGSPRSDRAIEEAALAALKMDPVLEPEDVSVKVADGVMELRGRVGDASARIAAEAAAWSASGVRHVVNNLSVLGEKPLNSLGSVGLEY